MTASAGRILKRLATKGGHALLLGKIVKKEVAKIGSGGGASAGGGGKKAISIASMMKSEQATKESVEIYAVCEIDSDSNSSSGSSNSDSSSGGSGGSDNNQASSIDKVCELAQSLGLSVVGCGLGTPPVLLSSPTSTTDVAGGKGRGKDQGRGKGGDSTGKDADKVGYVSLCMHYTTMYALLFMRYYVCTERSILAN